MKHLISLVMIVVAIGLGTFGSSFSKEVYEILFGGRPVALYLSQVWGGVFNPLWFEGSALLGCVMFGVSISGALFGFGRISKSALLGYVAISVIILLSSYFISRPTPLCRLGGTPMEGVPSFAEFGLYYLFMIALLTGISLAVGKCFKLMFGTLASTENARLKETNKAGRINLGFTLVEVLAVIAIISVLAGLLLPLAFKAKRNAYATDDIAKLHQIYVGIKLYEDSNEGASPDSLLKLSDRYLPESELTSKMDSRTGIVSSTWPVNVGTDSSVDQEYAKVVSPILISFSYLKPFEHRFPNGSSFADLNSDSSVGLLTDTAVGECKGECLFLPGPEPTAGLQPAYNYDKFFVVRTDGSLAKRTVPSCHQGGPSYEMLFFFWTIPCIQTGA